MFAEHSSPIAPGMRCSMFAMYCQRLTPLRVVLDDSANGRKYRPPVSQGVQNGALPEAHLHFG